MDIINRFENAVIAKSFAGACRPEEAPEIKREYADARAGLVAQCTDHNKQTGEPDTWDANYIQCPWHNNGACQGQVSYNQHINDPRYDPCQEVTCPIFYWIDIINS
jgi:hypothetical protein